MSAAGLLECGGTLHADCVLSGVRHVVFPAPARAWW